MKKYLTLLPFITSCTGLGHTVYNITKYNQEDNQEVGLNDQKGTLHVVFVNTEQKIKKAQPKIEDLIEGGATSYVLNLIAKSIEEEVLRQNNHCEVYKSFNCIQVLNAVIKRYIHILYFIGYGDSYGADSLCIPQSHGESAETFAKQGRAEINELEEMLKILVCNNVEIISKTEPNNNTKHKNNILLYLLFPFIDSIHYNGNNKNKLDWELSKEALKRILAIFSTHKDYKNNLKNSYSEPDSTSEEDLYSRFFNQSMHSLLNKIDIMDDKGNII